MELKKTYVEEYGYKKVITDRNSPLCYLELDFLKLADGESMSLKEIGKETALIILYGKCRVSGENFDFPEVGKRADVFAGPAEAVYIGKDTAYTVTAKGDVKIAVCKAPAEKYFAPAYVKTEDIKTKDLGKGAYARKAAFNFPETVPANLLYIGEFWVSDGNWASFPPHKHDVDNMPTEGALDEIYYFEFDRPEGFGFQAVYTENGDIDEVYKVKTGDTVEVPRGYHPFTVAPNYKNYCLWIMAGKNRGIFSTTEKEHKWMVK
ncbi:MAG TPA: 5-deoxy-glucuronate isomerase [Clostridiales bacterium]|nr:5-deoxy-glucuronate isomerase [Clostridiales bacterium]